MPRIAIGIAAAALFTLTACGTTPGTPQPQDTATPPPTTAAAPSPTGDATPGDTASPTPDGTASPDSTATPTASGTATPTASTTAQASLELPARVESFTRVDQRSEDGVSVGTYRSDSLGSVVEVRLAQGRPARDFIDALGGSNPVTVGDAVCSTQGDTICAQERDGVTALVASKQLPAGVVSGLTTKVLEAR